MGRAGFHPSGGQGYVKGCVYRRLWLRTTLGSLSHDWWGCVLTLLVVWPEVFHHWNLQAVGWGKLLVPKWQPPGKLTLKRIPWVSTISVLVPRVSHIHTLSSQGKLQDEQVGLTQTPVSSRLLLLVSVCTRAGVCPLRAESQFPSICRAPPVKPTAFRAKLPGAFSSRCQTPQPGEPHMGSELSHLYKKFCNKFILQFVGHPHGDLGIGYTVSAALLTMVSSLCLWM